MKSEYTLVHEHGERLQPELGKCALMALKRCIERSMRHLFDGLCGCYIRMSSLAAQEAFVNKKLTWILRAVPYASSLPSSSSNECLST